MRIECLRCHGSGACARLHPFPLARVGAQRRQRAEVGRFRPFAAVGMALMAGGALLLTQVSAGGSYFGDIFLGLLVFGPGILRGLNDIFFGNGGGQVLQVSSVDVEPLGHVNANLLSGADLILRHSTELSAKELERVANAKSPEEAADTRALLLKLLRGAATRLTEIADRIER